MNEWGKTLLVATSLTPIFLVCGLNSLIRERWFDAAIYVALFCMLTFAFLYILYVVIGDLNAREVATQKVKPADKEVLAFLLSYLLPFFSRQSAQFTGELLTAVTVVVVIGLTVYHSNAYMFNPLLAILGYHFYEIESDGMTYLLITKQILITPENKLVARKLSDYIYIYEYKK